MDPLLGVFLFASVLLFILFRPRKPLIIHAYMNKMFMKVFLVVDLGIGMALWWAGISTDVGINGNAGFMILLFIIAFMCFAMVYVLYWGLPFSRKQKGVAAVDSAIARYRKQEEEVAGAWEPDLVVGDKAYSLVSYQSRQREAGLLAFDMQGNVVRDADLMHKIHRCSQLVIYTARPDMINQRTSGYRDTQKAISLLNGGLKKYPNLVKPIMERNNKTEIEHTENVKEALLLIQRYFPAVCEGWYLEAEWGNQHGNAYLKQVHYEDMLDLSNKIIAKIEFMAEEVKPLSAGIQSALVLQKLIQKHPVIERQSPDLKHLLDLVLTARKVTESIEEGMRSGEGIPSRYKGLNEEQIGTWQSRLAWVDQVDKAAG